MKNQTQHTAGPWIAHCDTLQGIAINAITDRGFGKVAFAEGVSKADAVLIASAPELADALRDMIEAFTDSRCTCHEEPEADTCGYCLARGNALEAACAILAKAQP